jgi:hypothetical protein
MVYYEDNDFIYFDAFIADSSGAGATEDANHQTLLQQCSEMRMSECLTAREAFTDKTFAIKFLAKKDKTAITQSMGVDAGDYPLRPFN